MKLIQFFLSTVFVFALIIPAFARCNGEAEIDSERNEALRKVVAATDKDSFHALSETLSQNGDARFVLYSTSREQRVSVYLASTSLQNGEHLSFTYDVSRYIPQFSPPQRSETRASQAEFRREQSPRREGLAEVLVDGCLDALTIGPAGAAVHMNLFARLADWDGANDVVFVIPEDGVIQPVLELSPTTTVLRRGGKTSSRSDSILAVVSSSDGMEIIWKLSGQAGDSMTAAGYFQYAVYQWESRGFRKTGSRDYDALEAKTQAGLQFRRCSRIEPVNIEYKIPTAN